MEKECRDSFSSGLNHHSRMMDIIGDKRVVMAGSGHKTETMLDHYAEHLEADTTMNRLRNAEAELFLPVFNELDGGGITVQAVEQLKDARIA
ncbi:MAG: hypothetical protein WCR31_11790 [Treponema sp.]